MQKKFQTENVIIIFTSIMELENEIILKVFFYSTVNAPSIMRCLHHVPLEHTVHIGNIVNKSSHLSQELLGYKTCNFSIFYEVLKQNSIYVLCSRD